MSKKVIFNIKTIFAALIIAILYILIDLYIGNYELINNTLLGKYPLIYKLIIVKGISSDLYYSFTVFQTFTLITIALLTGLNLTLITKKISNLIAGGKLKIIVGGSMLLGLATSSCTVCGLPLLAFLGLGGSIAWLPMEGEEFSLLTMILLTISVIIIIRKNKEALRPGCKIKRS